MQQRLLIQDGADRRAAPCEGHGIVLVVDDDAAQRFLERVVLEDLLDGTPVRVLEACGGREALDLVARMAPDEPLLAITDERMPGLDGPDWVAQCRAAGHGGRFVLLSSLPGLGRGAMDAVAVKPARPEELRGLLLALLKDWSPTLAAASEVSGGKTR